MEGNKKVFISYSWAVQERVVELAERLIANGIDVVLDVYDLKEGQDKYAFMEQSVNDVTIDRVLIICDKTYVEKANNRSGGVGDETVIISPEVYGQVNQEKFVAVVFDADEEGKAYLPQYIKSRIYIDLSTQDDRYESEYEKLLRNIYDKPLYRKPALGTAPEWLENEVVDLSAIRDTIKQIKGYTGGNTAKAEFLLKKGIEQLVESAKGYKTEDKDAMLSVIESTKPFRDVFVDFCEVLIFSSLEITDTICTFFEKLFNELHDSKQFKTCSDVTFEVFDYMIWELFISLTAILLYHEKYKDLHDVLLHPYFLRNDIYNQSYSMYPYFRFRNYHSLIETYCKPKTEFNNQITLSSKMLVERERKPILTKESISNADVLLYQLGAILELKHDYYSYWFPDAYIFSLYVQPIWQKLISRKHCEKIMPLFGVSSIEDLKEKVSKLQTDRDMRHGNSFRYAPIILSSVKLDEIGTLN